MLSTAFAAELDFVKEVNDSITISLTVFPDFEIDEHILNILQGQGWNNFKRFSTGPFYKNHFKNGVVFTLAVHTDLNKICCEFKKLAQILNFTLTIEKTQEPATFIKNKMTTYRLLQEIVISVPEYEPIPGMSSKNSIYFCEIATYDGIVRVADNKLVNEARRLNYVELASEVAQMTTLLESITPFEMNEGILT